MAAIDIVNRVFREFKRFTGDGLPNEPVGAPLPVGDPASGAWNPKKADLREALLAPLTVLDGAVTDATAQADRAETEADRAETAASGVEFPVSYAPQSLSPEQQEQARENIGVDSNTFDFMALSEV